MNRYSVSLFNKYTGEFETFDRLPVMSGVDDGIYGNDEIEAIQYLKKFLKDEGRTDHEINRFEYEAKFIEKM